MKTSVKSLSSSPSTRWRAWSSAPTRPTVHEYAPITALALDSAGQPVAGAVVTFSVYDDAHNHGAHHSVVGQSVTTDAHGRARVDIPSHHPDAVTVVASVRDPSGTTVVSHPAHIVWTDDSSYEREGEEEEEERHRYRRHRWVCLAGVGLFGGAPALHE